MTIFLTLLRVTTSSRRPRLSKRMVWERFCKTMTDQLGYSTMRAIMYVTRVIVDMTYFHSSFIRQSWPKSRRVRAGLALVLKNIE